MQSLGNLQELNQGPRQSGKGIEAVRAHVEAAGAKARSLGATLVPMRKIADDYLKKVEQEIGEGYEVVEEAKPASLIALHEQTAVQACLEELKSTPLLHKRAPAVHVINSNTDIKNVELLYRASEIALGFRPRKAKPASDATVVQAETIVEKPKRSWWQR